MVGTWKVEGGRASLGPPSPGTSAVKRPAIPMVTVAMLGQQSGHGHSGPPHFCRAVARQTRLSQEDAVEKHAEDWRDHDARALEFWRGYVWGRLKKRSATKWKRRLSACCFCYSCPFALVAWFFGRITSPLEGGMDSFTLMGATAARFVPSGRRDFVLAFAKATGKSGQVLLIKSGTAGERLRPEV